jgi:hypothetical protein
LQKYQHGFLDTLFSGLSCVVSVPFYTAFLPLLFWVCFIYFCLEVILDFIVVLVIIEWFLGSQCRVGMASWLGK